MRGLSHNAMPGAGFGPAWNNVPRDFKTLLRTTIVGLTPCSSPYGSTRVPRQSTEALTKALHVNRACSGCRYQRWRGQGLLPGSSSTVRPAPGVTT